MIGSPETSQPHPSPGIARAIQLGTDFVAVVIAGFVGVPLLVITFMTTIIGILYFSVLGFAAAGIALVMLPALGLAIIPALIAHIVESRESESPSPAASTDHAARQRVAAASMKDGRACR